MARVKRVFSPSHCAPSKRRKGGASAPKGGRLPWCRSALRTQRMRYRRNRRKIAASFPFLLFSDLSSALSGSSFLRKEPALRDLLWCLHCRMTKSREPRPFERKRTQPFYSTCLRQQATTCGGATPLFILYSAPARAPPSPLNPLHLLNPLNPGRPRRPNKKAPSEESAFY